MYVINWFVWKDGGMKIGNEEIIDMYLKLSGQCFLEVDEGICLFEYILFQQDVQYFVIVGQFSWVSCFLGMIELVILELVI